MSSDEDCFSGSTSCHFTCPSGGTWYVCPDEPYFIGCCSSDPCTNSNTTSPCPDVYAAAFDTSLFEYIRPNSCIDSTNGKWYTCNFTSPPFLGCCASDACSETDGCPAGDILASAWSPSRGDQLELFEDAGDESGSDDGEGGLSGGAIAGIVIGCVAAVVIVLFAAWFFLRRRKKSQVPAGGTPSVAGVERQSMYPGEYYGYQNPASLYQGSFSFLSPFTSTSAYPEKLIYPVLDSFPSPGTTVGGKYPSGSTGLSLPSLSPPLPSENGRPISELYSNTVSDETSHHRRSSSQNQGMGMFGAPKPETIPELDSMAKPPEVHEMDGESRS